MDRLGVLSEVVKSGKAARAVALEGTLAGMLSDMAGQMFASGEAQVARREVGAEETLAFLLF
jgi:ABC-type cobalamin transport system ATPase subunit